MNHQMFDDEHRDYLMMLSAPDYENLASPQECHTYINDGTPFSGLDEAAGETSGYLDMRAAKEIFSPRPDSDEKFDEKFSFKKAKSKDEINATGMELQPMLSNIDSPITPTSPDLPISFSNPSYQKGLNINDEDFKILTPEVKTSDNYVNMPQHKELLKNDRKCLAELVVPDLSKEDNSAGEENGPNYVNSHSRDWERVNGPIGWSAS